MPFSKLFLTAVSFGWPNRSTESVKGKKGLKAIGGPIAPRILGQILIAAAHILGDESQQ